MSTAVRHSSQGPDTVTLLKKPSTNLMCGLKKNKTKQNKKKPPLSVVLVLYWIFLVFSLYQWHFKGYVYEPEEIFMGNV